MPAPRLTPAQKTFGIGLLPAFEFFRPPEGMEFDPAYSNFTRQQQGLAAESQLQRQAFQQQRDELRRNQEVLAAEDDAIAAMKERPDEIPNILRSFPELARSRNLGGVLDYARAVTPSAAQKTLTPSIRKSLKPDEVAHFDRLIQENPDPVEAKLGAERMAAHETNLADMLSKGVPLSTIEQFRNRPLGPLERESIVQEHAAKRGVKDEFREQKLKGLLATLADQVPSMNSDAKVGPIVTLEDVLKKQAENYDLAHRMVYPEKYQQPPAIATPAAEGGNVAPAVTPAPTAAPVATLAPFVAPSPEDNIKRLEEALKAPAPEGLLPHQIEAQRAETRKKLADAQENLSIQKVANDVVTPVWNEEKADIDSLVSNYAKEMGYPAQSVWNAIASGAPLPSMSGQRGLVPAAYAILGENIYSVNPKFEKALSTLKGEASKVRPIGTFFSGIGGEFTPPTKNKILEAYAKEKAKPVASAAPAVNVASPEWKPGQSVAVPGGGTITRNK